MIVGPEEEEERREEFFLKIYLFIYFVALGLSCSRQAPKLRLASSSVVACGLLSCGM